MRFFLFRLVGNLTAMAIGANLAVGNGIGSAVAFCCNGLNNVFRLVGESLMKRLDKDRYWHAMATASQIEGLTELDLLASVTKLKEDALERRVWTVGHTVALNRIAEGLHSECGWSPARVHGYLRPAIEGIGVGYSSGANEEEEPIS